MSAYPKVAQLKTPAALRARAAELGIEKDRVIRALTAAGTA